MAVKKFLLVEIDGGSHSGWGECTAEEAPTYWPETVAGAASVLSDWLIPLVLSGRAATPEEFDGAASFVRGNRMAKSAVEAALWDLTARREGVSVGSRLGGVREAVDVGVSLGLQPTDAALVDLVERHVAQGYKRIKVKIEPGRDRGVLSAVRAAFPDIILTADANAAYRLSDADDLRRLDEFELDYLEQPLHHEDLVEHAVLARRMATPICLDESIRSAADARAAIALGSARVINIKLGRVGGFAEARRIHDAARAADLPVWCGGMLEAGVGRAANIHLATLEGFTKPGDTSSASRYFVEDTVTPMLEATDGRMPVPPGPGLGVEIRRDVLDRFTVDRAEFTP